MFTVVVLGHVYLLNHTSFNRAIDTSYSVDSEKSMNVCYFYDLISPDNKIVLGNSTRMGIFHKISVEFT